MKYCAPLLILLLLLAACQSNSAVTAPAALPEALSTPTATIAAPSITPTQEEPMTPTPLPHTFQIAAYFPEWEARDGYYVKNLETTGSARKITLINYAFGVPGEDPASKDVVCQLMDPSAAYGQVYRPGMSIDGVGDDSNQPLRGHFNQLKKLKAKYPHIKVVVSLGGWTGSGWFSDAARTAESRAKFVASCVDMYLRGDLPELDGAGGKGAAAGVFDGIDIDWEYPVKGGLAENHYHPDDGQNYVLLLEEFRKQYQAAGRPDFLLTMAGPGPAQAGQYNLSQAHPLLDLVAIMSYDFAGAWTKTASHHTNLCSPAQDPRSISADRTVQLYRDTFGIPAGKILIGGAFYGKSWKNVGEENHGLGQPGESVSTGSSMYHDLKDLPLLGYTRYWDEQSLAPFLYSAKEHIFWSYDDPQSLALKAQYARHFGLAGVMFWEITGDDDQGTLVDTLYRELQPGAPGGDPCAKNKGP